VGPRVESTRAPAAPPTQLDAGAPRFCQSDVSRGRKFGERHHWAAPAAFVGVRYVDLFARRLRCQLASLALGLPRRLAFLPHEAKAAGHSKSAVDDPSVPGVEQDLRGTI
jgi:hypothetical protein